MLSRSPCLIGVLVLLCSFWHESCSASGDGPSESECQPFVVKALHELKLTDNPDILERTQQTEHFIDDALKEPDDQGEIFIAESQNLKDEDDSKTTLAENESSTQNSIESHEALDLSTDATVSQVAQEIGSLSNEHSEEDINIQVNAENSSTDDVRSTEHCENDSCTESQEASLVSEETQTKGESLTSTENELAEDDLAEQKSEAINENSADLESSVEKNASEAEDKVSETEASSGSNADDDSNEETENVVDSGTEESEKNEEISEGSLEKENDEKTSEENDEKENEDNDEKASEENDEKASEENDEKVSEENDEKVSKENDEKESEENDEKESEENNEIITEEIVSSEAEPEDELLPAELEPKDLRNTDHIAEILYKDDEKKDELVDEIAETILRDLKRIYENSIRPLEVLYKYRDLSNRHFGDSEIFSKPLILFMGPWSGGKSTIINYLTDNQNTEYSLKSGAEPSPAYFNILMHGDEVEVLDGTRIVADWTFSGLQKFGGGLEDHLHGLRLPSNLLEKVNIVEIPGILEVRKQVSRVFPFNDACQWFIDRADIIFLVYDPTKLDVGPETEAILDQLKGREYQTRIILNKADRIKSEELIRVQSALIWNISPLMSSAQPPTMYTVSLWSNPFEKGAPIRLLQAQEKAFLKDIRSSIDKRIENKISGARRFAIRVRNHAKMVDCYLTTYYNHKSLFGNKKRIADKIIENPQNYHIYEGLSTLTNISRYDLPDPEVYRDFFHLNSLYEFKKLSETCTYFRGCPISKLDVAIAYDLPELVGKYKKLVDIALRKLNSDAS